MVIVFSSHLLLQPWSAVSGVLYTLGIHRLGEQRDIMTSVFIVLFKVRGCGLTWAGASKASRLTHLSVLLFYVTFVYVCLCVIMSWKCSRVGRI